MENHQNTGHFMSLLLSGSHYTEKKQYITNVYTKTSLYSEVVV
jgi:hypothetical protein